MILSSNQSVEDIIIEIIATSPYIKGPDLILATKQRRIGTAKQTIYTALQNLITNEIVSKVDNAYFISRIWLNKMNTLFKTTRDTDAVLELKEGDFITYSFPSLLSCDIYWAHILNLLLDGFPKNSPVFIWNPHEWFIIGRRSVEVEFLNKFNRQNIHAFFVTRETSQLDKEFKNHWNRDYLSIHTDNKISLKDNYYITIFGDLIIEVFITEAFARKIEGFYQKHQKVTNTVIKDFERIVAEKQRVRMKISKNSKKAFILRKKLSKGFHIPKHLK